MTLQVDQRSIWCGMIIIRSKPKISRGGFMKDAHLLFSVAVAALSLGSLPAHAQADAATAAQSAVAPQDSQVAPGDIVVTAQRTSSLASKTPVALTAVTGDSLIASGVTNPTQIADTVPNVSIDRANGNGLQITVRGITSSDGTEKGDPSAAFMQDGIYIARPQAQEASFFDIARVEVLRGPQGTLFGRNTTAGLVNIITNLPTFDFGGRVDATYGNYNQVQSTAVINVPASETVAFRAAVNYDRRDSFIKPS
jgi:iron complex outermembrane receptor protein